MKKALFISMLITVGIIICSCSKKDDSTTSNTNNTTSGLTIGTHTATGTMSFTAGGVNHSLSISAVVVASTVLTIQTASTDVLTNGMIDISCINATTAITTGTYSGANATVTYMLGSNSWLATYMTTGSSCTINITTLTATSIKGTFTATVVPILSGSNVTITNGIINCTVK